LIPAVQTHKAKELTKDLVLYFTYRALTGRKIENERIGPDQAQQHVIKHIFNEEHIFIQQIFANEMKASADQNYRPRINDESCDKHE